MRAPWRRRVASDDPGSESAPAEDGARSMPGPLHGRWTATFVLVGSAVMGATALALWNRRAIIDMRAQIDALASERRDEEAGEEIV